MTLKYQTETELQQLLEYDDAGLAKRVIKICQQLGLTPQQALDSFNQHAQSVYSKFGDKFEPFTLAPGPVQIQHDLMPEPKEQQDLSENVSKKANKITGEEQPIQMPCEQQYDDFGVSVKERLDEERFRIVYNNKDTYLGSLQGQLKHGKGQYHYANGQLYLGSFQEDLIHGYGEYTFNTGHIYKGNWHRGTIQGLGTLIHDSGQVYQGQFKDSLFEGQGRMKYRDGSEYEGCWREGVRWGYGVERQASGDLKIGQWEEEECRI